MVYILHNLKLQTIPMKHLRTILWVVLFLFIGYIILKPDHEPGDDKIVLLKAEVALNGDHIEVRNHDKFDYLNTRLTINEYYRLNGFNMESGEEYTLWQSEFAHSNKQRMPLAQKPILFTIWCDLPDGRKGYFTQRFK